MRFFSTESLQNFQEINFHFIRVRKEASVFYLTLNRPEKRNAFTPTMVHEIAFALAYAQERNEVWSVVIEAEGTVFCAGMDLNVFQNPTLDAPNEALPAPQRELTLGDIFKNFHKPCIAKVEGNVYAGGFLIIGGCTFVLATKEVEFSLPEVKRGIFPMQVMASLLKIMSPRKVLEMCILAKSYSAQEVYNLGLVTHLATKESIQQDLKDLLAIILENSPFAIRKGINAFHAITNIPEEERSLFLYKQLKEIQHSADADEGIRAFRQKRKPEWTNN